MPTFSYVAKDSGGRLVRSSVEAASRFEALSSLRGGGLTVVDLDETGPAASTAAPSADPARRAPRLPRSGRISRTDLAVLCRQLSTAVNAGMPIRDALESINDDLEHAGLRKVVAAMIQDLHDGRQFSETLQRHKRVFGTLFVALIRAAEESGSMPQTLDQLADYLERSERLARKIKSIVAYPLFVIGFFAVVCAIMTLYILPQFEDVFSEYDAQLPLLTRAVLGSNRFILNHLPIIVAGFAALVAVAAIHARTRAGRYRLDRLKLCMPFFGTIIRKYAIARTCRTLSIMLRGGVSITTALEISADVSGNGVLEKGMLRSRDRIIKGMDLSGSLGLEKDYPRLVVRMIGIGEASGQLPEVMEKVADGYEDQVEGSITLATSLFEPVVICVLGGFVLTLVMAVYMPIFTVARAMQ
jgi:type IV pilus assembly protein PilC